MIAGLRHATDGLREEWRTGHLSVVGLPPTERFLVVGSLLIIASACVLVVFAAIGGGALGPEIGVVGKYVGAGIRGPLRVPVIVVPLTCLGLAVGQAAVAAAAARTGGGRARRMVVAIVLTNLALGGIAATTQGAVDAAIDAVPAGNMLVSGLWATTAALGFGSAVAVTALVIARPSAGRWLTPVLAALPFLAVSMALLLAAGPEGRLTPSSR